MSADVTAAKAKKAEKAEIAPRFYSVTDAASRLGFSRSHLYAMKAAGLIKFGKVLGKTVVSDVEIERVVASINEVAA